MIEEREFRITRSASTGDISVADVLRFLAEALQPDETPVRFVVTGVLDGGFDCEVGVLIRTGVPEPIEDRLSAFLLQRRPYALGSTFNAALLIPTGIGAPLGGHAGDGGAVARLLASACDTLVTHPNVVNAADINEMPPNVLYVEGSLIARLLLGTVGLLSVRANRILTVLEPHPEPWFVDATVNMVSASRAAAGFHCDEAIVLPRPLVMASTYSRSGRAVGRIEGFGQLDRLLCERRGSFDAVALATRIQVPAHYHHDYFADSSDQIVNPWGGVEAMLTHAVSLCHDVPSAHAPMMSSRQVQTLPYGQVDPRKAAEPVSTTYLFSVLKGLHRSPRVVRNPPLGVPGILSVADIHCLVIPDGCIGIPTLAALEQGIPVIAVSGNRGQVRTDLARLPFAPDQLIVVRNYLEAVGAMTALKAGVSLASVVRPLRATRVRELSSEVGIEDDRVGAARAL